SEAGKPSGSGVSTPADPSFLSSMADKVCRPTEPSDRIWLVGSGAVTVPSPIGSSNTLQIGRCSSPPRSLRLGLLLGPFRAFGSPDRQIRTYPCLRISPWDAFARE